MFIQNDFKSFFKKLYLKIRKGLLWPFLFVRKTKIFIKKDVRRILFLRHDRIGDMVLSTAALKALKRAYPQAKITVLASKRNHKILHYNPYVNEILIYDGIIWFAKTIRPRSYDLVIDPFLTYELKQAFLTYLSGGQYRIGFENAGREIFFNLYGPDTSTPKRMVEHLLDLVGQVGGNRNSCVPEIFLSGEETEWASQALANKGINARSLKIAVHPGAYYPSQRWPTDRFSALTKRIFEQYKTKIILLGSCDEKNMVKQVQKVAGKEAQDFSGLKLRKLMALVSKCDLLICNNSGPLHIASALKVPTVSMIGPTVTPLWLPYGKYDVVINKKLSCSPCNKAVCKDHECMELITVDEVFEAVKSQINHIRSIKKGESYGARKDLKLTKT